jgi:hypothetical protein
MSSSIDFCEHNYQYPLIAEFHNVWSSLFIIFAGFVGLMYNNPTCKLQYSIKYFLLMCVGVGSVCLHSSLHWFGQALDEISMLLLMVSLIYGNIYTHDIYGIYYFDEWYIAFSLFLVDFYLEFQTNYLVFLSTFVLLCSIAFYVNNITNFEKDFYLTCGIAGIGTLFWLLDMMLCNLLHDNLYYGGATFHTMWHILISYACYKFITLQILIHCDVDLKIQYKFWIFPVCVQNKKN